MHPVLQKIIDRPLSHKIIFWIVSFAVIGGLFWQYLLGPALEKRDSLQSNIEKLTTEISHERRLARDLPKFREEVKQLDAKLNVVLKELPDKREIPDLIDSISRLAKESGLEVNLFRPLSETPRDFYAELPVSMVVEGTFHQLATFFDEVGRLSRIVNINQISIHDPDVRDDRVVVKADCVATTFRYLDDTERISKSQETEAHRRRRR